MFPSDHRIPLAPPLHCKQCGKPYKGLGCPACLLAKSIAEITRQQSTYVPMAAEGRITVTLCRWRAGEFHIALYGNLLRSFCNKSLKGATRVRIPYNQINRPYETCSDCVVAFGRSLQEAKKEEQRGHVHNYESKLDGESGLLENGTAGADREVPPRQED